MEKKTRLEHDLIGEMEIPADCYCGVQTLRAVENFKITGMPISHYPEFIQAFAYVKKAAALANNELGILENDVMKAIVGACDEIIAGKLLDQFMVDVFQGGAGTSTNMNANEVIANRALELMGLEKGKYDKVHPNNHVNLSQSTNDAYPTAIKLAVYVLLNKLMKSMEVVEKAFAAKGKEWENVIKMGRTQLQDAVPMTLGQEFTAYASSIRSEITQIREVQKLMAVVNMGATAIGTGINAPPDYARVVAKHMAKITGIPVTTASDLIEATWDTTDYAQVSGQLKRFALKISKVCDDLRLLSSGPRTGIREINLPPMQPGSSIMPGKVNPVIPEVMNQVAYQVIGADVTISFASSNGQLELNVMEPVIAYNLFQSIESLSRTCHILVDKCVKGITANKDHCRKLVENSIGIVTALNPAIGYENSTMIAKEALETGKSVAELVLEKKLLTKEKLSDLLTPENMLHPRDIKSIKK
ncbi:MAG: aspartate ammonia-lyase [Nitrospirota bacterium]